MYNSRQQKFKEQVLQPDDEMDDDFQSPLPSASVTIPESPPPPARASITIPELPPPRESSITSSERRRPQQQTQDIFAAPPQEQQERTAGPTRFPYSGEFLKLIPKNAKWNIIKEETRNKIRAILIEKCLATLAHIAGSTENNINLEAEQILKYVAKTIDKELKTLLFPTPISIELFKGSIIDDVVSKQELNKELRELACEIIKEEENEELLAQEQEELSLLEEELKKRKEGLSSDPVSATKQMKPNDYVQSLMLYPTSSAFN